MAHWSFDDCTAKDNSGNGHDGSINGNPQCVEGVRGKAFSFDGNSSIKSSDYLNQIINDKTLVAWVKLNDLEQQKGGVVGIGTDLYVKDNFDSIVYGEWNKYHWLMGSTGFYRSSEASSFVENSTSWVLMAITYTDNNYKIYRNGELIDSTTKYKTSTFEKDSFFYVGKRAILDCSHSAKVCLNAVIDEARIYNRALSEVEIQQLYKGEDSQPKGNADLNMSISAPSSVSRNQKNTYTFTIANPSKINAKGVKAHFVVPRKSVATVEIPQNCTLNGRIIECKLSDLNAGQSATQTLSMTVLKKGALNLVGLVNASDDDANYDDNKTSTVLSVK